MPVALVTGAARGIGRATVELLVAYGWDVVAYDCCSDDPTLSYPLASPGELTGLAGPRVRCVQADARDTTALRIAVGLAEEAFGGLDAAVACAGVIAGGSAHWESSSEAARTVLEVDLWAVMELARVAVPALLRRPAPRQGRFVAVASAAATRGLPLLAAYCAAKAGVTGFVRALAAELGPTGVTANCVNPGSTDTAMLAVSAAIYGLESSEVFAAQQPVRRLLEPAEVAAAIGWLLSPAASAVTGVALPVDGGLAL